MTGTDTVGYGHPTSSDAGTDIVGCGMSDTARPGPGRVGKLYIFHAWLAKKGKGRKKNWEKKAERGFYYGKAFL
jgi:hypothetical protein